MTRDRPDRSASDGPGSDPSSGSWVSDLRDLERRDAEFSPSRRLRALAARRRAEEAPTTPDREPPGETGTADTMPAEATTDAPSVSRFVAAIRRAASVEDLTPVGSPGERRYGRAVDAHVVVDGTTYDLELRLFGPAEDGGFAEGLAAQVDRWVGVSDVDGVVPALDGAKEPRPWTLTAPVRATLADRPPETVAAALRAARALSEALATLHERGVVHAGLDPGHVVYPSGSDRPQLDNVGLVDVYRRYTDPATVLDPRYAPPEYFDDRYGVVDRTTDVYGLGATFYHLFTGQPPHEGGPADVREAVLSDPFPRPSASADVPAAVDEVVRTATATDKFDRYNSAGSLLDDVRRLCERFDGQT